MPVAVKEWILKTEPEVSLHLLFICLILASVGLVLVVTHVGRTTWTQQRKSPQDMEKRGVVQGYYTPYSEN